MFGLESLSPKLENLFKFIQWYIDNFGVLSFFIVIVGSIYFLCVRALLINLRQDEYERVFMIVILMIVILGGLIGFVIEYSGRY
ncbi:MAG: hypothetical protein FH753_01695 [Firmicutes bacterium]|nr:hypothetical protein [Bacillota bacterium]